MTLQVWSPKSAGYPKIEWLCLRGSHSKIWRMVPNSGHFCKLKNFKQDCLFWSPEGFKIVCWHWWKVLNMQLGIKCKVRGGMGSNEKLCRILHYSSYPTVSYFSHEWPDQPFLFGEVWPCETTSYYIHQYTTQSVEYLKFFQTHVWLVGP